MTAMTDLGTSGLSRSLKMSLGEELRICRNDCSIAVDKDHAWVMGEIRVWPMMVRFDQDLNIDDGLFGVCKWL
jgi:hypothetical protein